MRVSFQSRAALIYLHPENGRLIFALLSLALVWPRFSAGQNETTTPLARIVSVDTSKIVARKLNVSLGSTYEVSLKGLIVPDIATARTLVGDSFWEPANFRLLLLDKGIAYLASDADRESPERSMQDEAAKRHLGIWSEKAFRAARGYPDPVVAPSQNQAPTDQPSADPAKNRAAAIENRTWITGVWDSLVQHWPETLTATGALLSALALVTWRKRWEIIVMGTSGVGKTEFVGCVQTDGRWLQHAAPTSTINEQVTSARLRSRSGRSVYHLKWCDIGGQYPKWLFERLAKRRHLLLFRRRLVIVLILSPYKSPDKPVVDDLHVERQYGWVESLVKGFIESRYGKKCKGVMLFINMLDLYTDSQLQTSAAREFQDLFKRHAAALGDSHPNILRIAGSAKQAWNTNEAWKWILQTVSGEVQG